MEQYRLMAGMLALLFGVVPAFATTNFACAPRGAQYMAGKGEPVCTLNTTTDTVSCTGTALEGIGRTNATATLMVTACATMLCHDPQNDAVVESHSTTVSESTSNALRAEKNKSLLVPAISDTITTQDVGAQFACPVTTWREEVTDVMVMTYTYTLRFAGFTCNAITVTGP